MQTSLANLLSKIQLASVDKLSRRAVHAAAEITLRGSAALMALFALFGFNPQAVAATDTWVGNTSVNWADSNWAASGNNPPATGDSLVFGVAGSAGSILTENLMTPATYTIDGITFTAGASAYTINPGSQTGSGFTLGGNIVNDSTNTETINDPVTLFNSESLITDASGGNLTFGGGILGGTSGITLSGGGTVTLNGTASTYTGATTVNSGTLSENFSFSGSAASNLINPSSALSMGGGTLQIIGNASVASSQTFASASLTGGANVINVAPASGTQIPTLSLGALTGSTIATGATLELNGAATNTSASTAGGTNDTAETALTSSSPGAVAATGNIMTTTEGAQQVVDVNYAGLLVNNLGAAYATVGLYDWATTDVVAGTAGTSPYTIVGGSQVQGFYTILNGAAPLAGGENFDVTGNSNFGGTDDGGNNNVQAATFRFNVNAAITIGVNEGGTQNPPTGNEVNVSGILVTPNVAENNITFNTGGSDGLNVVSHDGGIDSLSVFQNNTEGELIFSQSTAGATYYMIRGAAYTQSGAGTVSFLGLNGYAGATYLNGGVLEFAEDLSLGDTTTSNLNLNGGTLLGNYTGNLDAGSSATAHPIVLGGNGGGVAATAGNSLTVDGVISGAAGTGPLIIGIPASSANSNTLGLVPGTGANTANTTAVNATGVVVLSNPGNSYTGGTVLDSGTLQLSSVSNIGTGAVTFNGGAFQWGTGNTTDISALGVTLAAGGGIFDTNGNNVTFANPIGNGGSGGVTVTNSTGSGSLTLNGNNTFTGGVTVNSGALLTLGGANIYTGNTSVSGTLALTSSASLGNTTITVASGGTLDANGNTIGTTGARLTLQGASVFALGNNSIDTVILNSTVAGGTGTVLSVGGASSAASLDFDLNNTASDKLIINNGVTAFGADGGKIFITDLNNLSPLLSYTLISDPNGGLAVGTSPGSLFELGTTSIAANGTTYALSLANSTSTALILTLTPAAVNYYWTGAVNSSWSGIGNFATTNTGGTNQTALPGKSANVFLTANSAANFSQTLDGNYTVNSLSFTGTGTGAATHSITLANGTGTALTINGANGFSDSAGNPYVAGTGLVVQPGSAAHTISTNINLGNSQSWDINNSNSNPLTVSGVIADAPGTSLDSLTVSGSGTLILTNSNTYDGGTIVSGGTLRLGGTGGALSSTSALTVNGGTFDLGGNNQAVASISGGGVSTGVITSSTGAATLTLNNTGADTFSGSITDSSNAATSPNDIPTNGVSLALYLAGPGNVSLSGSNSFSGGVTLASGNLTVSNNYGLGLTVTGTASSVSGTGSSPAGLTFANTSTSNVFFTSANPHVASINSGSATGADNIILGNATAGTATTLFLGGGGTAQSLAGDTFGGTISDQSGLNAAAVGSLEIIDGGFVQLSGTNTFTGTTVITGSNPQTGFASELQLGNPDALENSTLNYNDPYGFLSFGSLTATTLAGLTGAEGLALTNNGSTAVTLTVGNNNVSSTYTGLLSGAGGLVKVGSGTFQTGSGTQGGATYAGATTVDGGTLIIGGASNLTGGLTVSQSTLIFQDNAIVNNSGGVLYLDNVSGTPANANLTVSGTANVTLGGFSFGNGTRANGVVTVQNSGSLTVNGSYDFLDDIAGTTTAATTATDLNGGVLAVQNFILGAPGLAAATAVTLNLNGGTLEALANDPSGSFFLPAITQLTVNVQGGGAIINSNGFNITIAQPLVTGTLNDGGLTKTGAGILYLSGNNTYVGPTNINGGELNPLNVNSFANTSAITFNGGGLQYSGSNTQDYSAKILNSTMPIAVDVNGQNVTFATGLAASNAGGLTVADSVPSTGGLTLTGSNVYSGPTTVNSGAELVLGSGGSLPNSTVTVNGTLLAQANNFGIGAGSASLNLNSGSTLSLVDGAIGSLTINGGMTIGGSTGPAALDFEIDTDTGTADNIVVTGGALNFGTGGGGVITLTDIGATTVPASGLELTLITDASGLGSHLFTLNPSDTALVIDGQSYLVSLANSTSTTEMITLTQSSFAYYWTGNTSASWKSINNFTVDPAGTEVRSGTLSATSDVFLTANTATHLSQTLDGTYAINSLSFTGTGTTAGTTPDTLASGTGTALTIEATSSFGDANNNNYPIGTGLVVQAGAAADSISANINLGASQSWQINNSSSNPLTVTGVIADAPATTLDSLTKTGPGTLVLSNAEIYDGGTIVNQGTLMLGTGGSLLTTGTLTVTGTGTFDLAGHSQMIGGLSDGGVSTGIITSSTGAATLTVNNLAPSTYSGAITDNNSVDGASLALVLAGSSNVTLSGSSNFTGGTNLQSGNLTVAANYALAGGTTGLILSPALSGTVTAFFTSANPTIAALNNPGMGTSNVVLGNTIGSGSATTLNIGAGGGTSIFTGAISDLTGTKATAIGSLNVSGGSLILNGTDTFTGTTSVSSGTLTLGNSLALENSTLNYNNQGGVLSFGSLTAVTLGGLSGAENLALTNTNSVAIALTIGNNNVSSVYNGSLTGASSVTKSGTGTITFSNANYTSATTVNAGTLTISGGSVGSPTSNVTIAETGNGLNVSGGTFTAGTVNIAIAAGQTGGSASISGSGSAAFANVVLGAGGNTGGELLIDTSGSAGLGAVTVVKDVGGAASGIVVEAGTVTATSMSIQGNGDKVANLNITGGSLVIGNSSSGGAFEVGTVGDGGVLTMTGGSLTYAGTDGLLLSPGAGVTATASITGSNAVATLTGITVNDGNSATGTSTLTVGGAATLYLGSVGLVVNLPSATTDAAFGTATVGAIAPWSSSAPISLTGTTTLQAADSNGNANNITLSGVLSGTGGLAVSGTGFVTLTAANTYTGSTTVNTGGRLIVSGSLSATAAATVASGGRLEVDGLLNNSITAVVNGRLSGTGVVGGAAINGTLAPGLTEADKSSAVGTLTAKGAISLASTATLNIRVGLTTGAASNPTTGLGGDVDQLFMNGGTFSLDDSSLQIFSNPAELGAAPDSLYVIINGGASATGTGTDVFAGIPASGDSITASNGNVFEVFYGVTAGSTTTPGSDIDVEFVAVPEPGAWTSLVGGIGMLIVWQRTRRRRT